MTAIENAKRLAATLGRNQFWTVYEEADESYIVADHAAQCAGYGRGRYMVTDDKAIELARKAGVDCDNEGRIA